MRIPSVITGTTVILILSFWGMWTIWSCAAIAPPSGGPRDEEPPVLLSVDPPSGTVHFSGGITRLVFSEYMAEKSLSRAIKVFPRLAEPVDAIYKGREIWINWPVALDSNQTYILSLSRELTDEHEVALATALQLAYSTGESVAEGSIAGQIYGEASGVNLWRLRDGEREDSVFFRYPDYTTETDDEGFYRFRFLIPGRYQVFAVEKAGLGQPFQTRQLVYGLPAASPLTLTAGEYRTAVDILSRQEEEPLRVKQGKWSVPSWGRIDFSTAVETDREISISEGEIVGESQLAFYPDPLNPNTLIVESPAATPGANLTINIVLGNSNDTTADTTRLAITIPAEPESSRLQLVEPNKSTVLRPETIRIVPLDIIFSQPAINSVPDSWGSVRYDTVAIDGKLTSLTPLHWQFLPRETWKSNSTYTLTLDSTAWQAKNGFGFIKPDLQQTFTVGDMIGFGDISGMIEMPALRHAAVQVTAVENSSLNYVSAVNSTSEFRFTSLEEGMYTLMVFDDRDENLRYSYGSVIPFRTAEWFRVLPDTVAVRANWEITLHPIMIEEE